MAKKPNKIHVAGYAMHMLYELYKGDYDKVMDAYHEILPDDYFDGIRPTDSAVWEETVEETLLGMAPPTSTYWRAWYAAYRLVNMHTTFVFVPTTLQSLQPVFDEEVAESEIEALAAE